MKLIHFKSVKYIIFLFLILGYCTNMKTLVFTKASISWMVSRELQSVLPIPEMVDLGDS